MPIYSLAQMTAARRGVIPKHVAIIMDGNRRWAKHRGLPPFAGHLEGVNSLMEVVEGALTLGVKVLTVFGFSTENWQRSPDEVNTLLDLLQTSLKRHCPTMIQQGVRLRVIGDLSRFPASLLKSLQETIKLTEEGRNIDLVLALNYGGRDDIRRGVIRLLEDVQAKKIAPQQVTEEMLAHYLDTAAWPDPDLLIRTSGEMRLSNFLLWQSSYAEIVFSNRLWPDFRAKELLKSILEFQQRDRRMGRDS
jgi:undecaprenyl diphosphate synthase